MRILERLVQTIAADKWPQLREANAAFEPVQRQLGFPPTRHYQALAGVHGTDIQISEREWDSMAAMEAGWEKLMSGPQYAELEASLAGVVLDNRWEFYLIM